MITYWVLYSCKQQVILILSLINTETISHFEMINIICLRKVD